MIDPGNLPPLGGDEPQDKRVPNGAAQRPAYAGQPDDLHDLFAVGSPLGQDEDDPLAALRSDPNYSALIRDLEYIAKQARLLFEPAQEAPSDEVWKKIQDHLPKAPDA